MGTAGWDLFQVAAERKVVLDAYKQRLEMLYNRLHALGLVLNPLLHSKHKFDGTCMVETRQYIDAYFASESDKAARCHQQLDNFRDKKGEFHGDGASQHQGSRGPFKRLSEVEVVSGLGTQVPDGLAHFEMALLHQGPGRFKVMVRFAFSLVHAIEPQLDGGEALFEGVVNVPGQPGAFG